MKITVFGTGPVGKTLSGKLAELGHEVTLGTRDVAKSLAGAESDSFGNPPLEEWLATRTSVTLATFADGAARSELIVNATNGAASLAALEMSGEENLRGKIVLDLSNPLDVSHGMPPSLFVSNTDSLGEQIQRRFPQALVVKALNTVNANLMINPSHLAQGDHTSFVCGNSDSAKATVRDLLTSMGWIDVIDLGDISGARAAEMYLALWIRLMITLDTPAFSIKVVR
jgi:predicted dinucleotide-binding enzyme